MGKTIGLFDSGHGGLDLLRTLRKTSEFDLLYIADLKFHPYGKMSIPQIKERSHFLCQELLKKGPCDLIAVACNTATAHAIDDLRKDFSVPFVGVEPYLNYINKAPLEHLQRGGVGALVTPNTLNSDRFKRLKEEKDPNDLVSVLALEELAPLVEDFLTHKDEDLLVDQLKELFRNDLPLNWQETILGCTHYPLISIQLEKVLNTRCISPTPQVVEHIFRLLLEKPTVSPVISRQDFDYWNTLEGSWRKALLEDFF